MQLVTGSDLHFMIGRRAHFPEMQWTGQSSPAHDDSLQSKTVMHFSPRIFLSESLRDFTVASLTQEFLVHESASAQSASPAHWLFPFFV